MRTKVNLERGSSFRYIPFLPETNIEMEIHHLKMLFLLENVNLHCHVSLLQGSPGYLILVTCSSHYTGQVSKLFICHPRNSSSSVTQNICGIGTCFCLKGWHRKSYASCGCAMKRPISALTAITLRRGHEWNMVSEGVFSDLKYTPVN